MRDCDPFLVTGASGYVGSHLLPALLAKGHDVRALTRDASGADFGDDVEVFEGDAASGDGLQAALEGCATAYYLIHSMGDEGGGDDEDFAAQDRKAAENFATAAKRAGVSRIIYLGGLAGESEHLQSREQTAKTLAEHGPETVHARAAMVIGAGSDSFEIVRNLVHRLPLFLAPRWVDTRTQPISVDDAVAALIAIAEADEVPDEIELGGADVLTYGEMMTQYARVTERRVRPIIRVPVMTPRLSSYWVALFTPVELGIIQPLVEGLSEETIVETPPPKGINDAPMGFDDAVRAAIA